MPLNPVASPRPAGRLNVIAGPMFSGKSEELMRRVRRAKIAGVNVLVLSHSLDTRSDLSAITSHDGINIPAVPVGDVETLAELARAEDYELVAIDEAQFFGPDLVPTVFDLVETWCCSHRRRPVRDVRRRPLRTDADIHGRGRGRSPNSRQCARSAVGMPSSTNVWAPPGSASKPRN
ncbi:thymidine kinase [Brevibacterium sp. UCMA 11754]|uniref:thymidine kinase n=1 Tax=Brevibacterium sp. UCMA 11754 TaxID=2749198 RepID=UPI002E1F6B7D